MRSRYGRRAALVAVAVLVMVAAGGGLQAGQAGNTSTKYYSTSLPLTNIAAGTTLSTTVKLTNDASSTQTLGSENITIPTGFTVTPISASTTSDENGAWSETVSGGAIQLRAVTSKDALNPGHSVTFNLTVAASCSVTGSQTWTSEAKQSNSFNGPPGNDFKLIGSDPTSSVGGACRFSFDPAIASPRQAGVAFTASIKTLDGNGVATSNYNGTATLSGTLGTIGGKTPVYGTSTGAVTFVNGQASASVTAYKAEAGRTLTVTDGVISGTSATFDVEPGAPASLAFSGQPSDTQVTTATASYPISPAVTVDVFDSFGNSEDCTALGLPANDCTQANVLLSIANDAGKAAVGGTATTLGGKGPVTSISGTASFANVTLDQSGTGFTLLASAVDSINTTLFSSLPSSPFDVFDNVCNQTNPYSTCSATKNGTSVTTDYSSPTTDPTRFQMTASGQPFDCGGSQSSTGAIVTFDPAQKDANGNPYTYKNPIIVTLEWDKTLVPGTGVANFVLCLAKPIGSTDPNWPAGQYQVVQDCPAHLRQTTVLPCASNRNRDNAGDLKITLLTASGDPAAGLH